MSGNFSANLQSDSIQNPNQKYKKPKAIAVIGGVAAGTTVNSACKIAQNPIAMGISKQINKINISADEFSSVEQGIIKTLKNTGLKDKGVSIIKATAENAKEIDKIALNEINNTIFKHCPDFVKNIIGQVTFSSFKSGDNAGYTFCSKKIILPEEKFILSAFHEVGHAANANLSKFTKLLQKCRSATILAIPIAMIALFKTKKAPDEKPKNAIDKTTTFIKNNAGKLTFATFLPMLAEEGLASLKGNKFAKQVLTPELAKKVAKNNSLAYCTYLALAVLSGVGICMGTKVKDAIASKKLITEKND